jgi:tRNA-5-methyluridine54 2-sulfurtransferase
MKCRKCSRTAVINMRRHKLALCDACFLEWFPAQAAKAIKRYSMIAPGERVLVAVSGGKDSLGLWDILLRLGYHADGVYIDLGIGHEDYSVSSLSYIERFVEARAAEGVSLQLHVIDIAEQYGQTVPDLAQGRRPGGGRKACSLCGLIKRHEMNRVAHEGGYAVLATGHNLDDEAATLLQNALHWQTGYLGRQSPALPSIHSHLARKVKPLCHLYERESAAYTLVRGIDYIQEECPYSTRATSIFFKGLLDQLEARSPGAKLQFYLAFLAARREGRVEFEQLAAPEFSTCDRCGQPTLAPDLCAFCRIWEAGSDGAAPDQRS